ncbi:MAG: Flp pilus assembly complex ATPase component TadA, partial [Nanoarchaeota archaeon]|nr:Flp pilus assembly complex ATPase component TadA [Nanoarchaeota archaeon]
MLKDSYNFYSDNIPINVKIESEKDEFVFIYKINISKISETTEIILDKIREELIDKVKLGIADITDPKKMDYIKSKFKNTIIYLITKYFPDITEDMKEFFTTYLMQKSFGLGKIEILLSDANLEEIAVNNAEEPIWVYHHKHGWLKTNVILKDEGIIKHYSSLIGRKVGRSITLLSPLLDAHLTTGDRVNATLFPITTKGNTITIRKFSAKPITITDMLLNRTISVSAAALVWMAVQYELSTLVTGGTSTGKSSFLNVISSFFPPNQRVISIEDSVLPESQILYRQNKILKKTTIGNLVDDQIENNKLSLLNGTEVSHNVNAIEVFSMDSNGKIKLTKPSSFIRHKVNKKILDIKLASGRNISVTKDHSLFSMIDNKIKEVKGHELDIGSFIATPRNLYYKGDNKIFDLTDYLKYFENFMVGGGPIKKIISKLNNKIVNKSTLKHYRNKHLIPVTLFKKYNYLISEDDKKNIYITSKRKSKGKRPMLPFIIKIDKYWACLCGLWLADGCYDKRSILISVPEDACRGIVNKIASKISTKCCLHSDKITMMINSVVLKTFFEKVLDLKGNAYTKKVPLWIYNLNEFLLSNLLKGYFSGDGCVKKYEVCVSSSSMELLEDIQTLLLRFEILLRIPRKLKNDKTYESRISTTKFLRKFKSDISFLQDYKNKKLDLTLNRKEHDVSDIIPLSKITYLNLKRLLKETIKSLSNAKTYYKSWHRFFLNSHIGRSTLLKILRLSGLSDISIVGDHTLKDVLKLAHNDVFWDKIIEIKERNYFGYVYDLSVPCNENFICENIIAHNTRELQLPKYLHWVPMITREQNPEGKGEISMLDLVVNSLRMRPDRIVVGEIRRKREAEVLFEAMHTGHSVYATLHANDTNETITRLTNPPIEIPKAMLPAISLIVVMYRNRRTGIRRIFQISEILKNANANVLLQLDMKTDTISTVNNSVRLFPELEMQTGLSSQEINADLKDKA